MSARRDAGDDVLAVAGADGALGPAIDQYLRAGERLATFVGDFPGDGALCEELTCGKQ